MSNPLTTPVRLTPFLPASARPTVMSRPAPERHSVSDGIVAPIGHQRPSVSLEMEDAIAELSVGDTTSYVTLPPSERPTALINAVESSAAETVAMPAQSAAITAAFFARGSTSTPTQVQARVPTNGIAVASPRPSARVVFPAIYPIVPSTAPIAARLPLPAPTPTSVRMFAHGSIPPATHGSIADTSIRTLGAAGSTPMYAARGQRRHYAPPTPTRVAADANTLCIANGSPVRALTDNKSVRVTAGAPSTPSRAIPVRSSKTANWIAAGDKTIHLEPAQARGWRVSPLGTSGTTNALHARERRLAWIYMMVALFVPLLAPIGWVHAEEQVERFPDRLFRVERLAGLVLTLMSVALLACTLTVLVVH